MQRRNQTLGLLLLLASIILMPSLASGGATAAGQGLDPENLPKEMSQSLEQLLDDPEGIAPDRSESRCVRLTSAARTEILDHEHLVFRSTVGGKAWLNRLSPGCSGMRPDMALVLSARNGRMCALDQVSGISQGAGIVSSGRCSLGKFEPITPLHANALKDAFKLRGKEIAAARSAERVEQRKARRAERKARRAARKNTLGAL